jgi:hypothetical protein
MRVGAAAAVINLVVAQRVDQAAAAQAVQAVQT